jgi:hypothetical protein
MRGGVLWVGGFIKALLLRLYTCPQQSVRLNRALAEGFSTTASTLLALYPGAEEKSNSSQRCRVSLAFEFFLSFDFFQPESQQKLEEYLIHY